ncbi:hypothetical protein FPHYL_522 [Fusarium phyllophilum]|uniref:Uncharacterized protein n=1 Tax=Fusarium phyllophilum TaxID=47803 RepID=A0A8H5KF39_9HYPO|nr:hypothetical protein FPHYL_522 [Fusarium phyllophilum]
MASICSSSRSRTTIGLHETRATQGGQIGVTRPFLASFNFVPMRVLRINRPYRITHSASLLHQWEIPPTEQVANVQVTQSDIHVDRDVHFYVLITPCASSGLVLARSVGSVGSRHAGPVIDGNERQYHPPKVTMIKKRQTTRIEDAICKMHRRYDTADWRTLKKSASMLSHLLYPCSVLQPPGHHSGAKFLVVHKVNGPLQKSTISPLGDTLNGNASMLLQLHMRVILRAPSPRLLKVVIRRGFLRYGENHEARLHGRGTTPQCGNNQSQTSGNCSDAPCDGFSLTSGQAGIDRLHLKGLGGCSSERSLIRGTSFHVVTRRTLNAAPSVTVILRPTARPRGVWFFAVGTAEGNSAPNHNHGDQPPVSRTWPLRRLLGRNIFPEIKEDTRKPLSLNPREHAIAPGANSHQKRMQRTHSEPVFGVIKMTLTQVALLLNHQPHNRHKNVHMNKSWCREPGPSVKLTNHQGLRSCALSSVDWFSWRDGWFRIRAPNGATCLAVWGAFATEAGYTQK